MRQVDARCFTCNPLKQPHKIVIITLICRWGNRGSENSSHVPEVTQPIGIQTQVCLTSLTGQSPQISATPLYAAGCQSSFHGHKSFFPDGDLVLSSPSPQNPPSRLHTQQVFNK